MTKGNLIEHLEWLVKNLERAQASAHCARHSMYPPDRSKEDHFTAGALDALSGMLDSSIETASYVLNMQKEATWQR